MAVPKIRFPGFTEDWEQRKLGQIIEVKPFKPYIAEANNTGKYPVIQQGDKPLLGYSDKNEPFRDYKSVTLFGDHTLSLFKPLEPFFVATDGIKILSSAMYGLFFYYLLDRYKPHSEGYKRHFSILKEQDCWITSQNEQEKIGNFFFGIDQAITLHQRKLEGMKLLKKSLLQKMFPKSGESVPEVRFPGFTDAWEQRKLGAIATFLNGRAYKQDELLTSGKYKVLRVGNFYTNDRWYYSDLELADKFYADKGDLLYTWSASFGPHIWLGDKVIYHYHIWKVVLSEYILKDFALQILEKDKQNILSHPNGSTMIHVTKVDMENKQICIPCLAEQQKIGNFFKYLDETITLHQRKVEALQKLKKSLLQQMFV